MIFYSLNWLKNNHLSWISQPLCLFYLIKWINLHCTKKNFDVSYLDKLEPYEHDALISLHWFGFSPWATQKYSDHIG